MSEIHDRIMVALANTPGTQRTVLEITRYVNEHFIRSPYTPREIKSALTDLADEKSAIQHASGRWSVADGRRRGSEGKRHPEKELPLVKRVNRA